MNSCHKNPFTLKGKLIDLLASAYLRSLCDLFNTRRKEIVTFAFYGSLIYLSIYR